MSNATEPASSASSLKRVALGDLEQELATTRRVLERVPEEHFGWKPHEKSMSLGALATHLATLPFWGSTTIGTDELDIAANPLPPNPLAENREALLARFDDRAGALRAALEGADDEALLRPWTFRSGDHVILRGPKMGIVRTMVVSHMAHHRGQLSVYLRLLDVPVPSVYGPTADEPAAF
ncbi:MAG TPA: DinB family protein [Longimicrobium sp.]|nr:DinB family protein [Longimicrobium sp.]